MCGICGIFDLKDNNRIDKNVLEKMNHKLSHRGPDGTAYYLDNTIGLGFSRLSIIDLIDGMQPMINEDKSLVLVCNGEIFNYRELKKDLEFRGHRFKTNCDVEVILHLYEEYGENFLKKLNGQFSFVLYNTKKKELLCARDHAGILPFYYTQVNGLFIFASEIKAILEHPYVMREVDLTGLDQVMSFPGIISPRTMFRNIYSLECGQLCLIKDGIKTIKQYWDLEYYEEEDKGEKYYQETLEELLQDSIRLRLQADVPVGYYVSGGLDSSIIVSQGKKLEEQKTIQTYSVDFLDNSISEGFYQEKMAKYVKSEHNRILVTNQDIIKYLEQVIYHSECPLKETFNVASFLLSQTVRSKGTKVILTGEGADELFGGYSEYVYDLFRNKQITESEIKESNIRKQLFGDETFFYEKNYASFTDVKKLFYSNALREEFANFDAYRNFVINKDRVDKLSHFNKRSYIDMKLRLSDHLLSEHGDRMAYANSVEARYPFLDKRVIEFSNRIPYRYKLKVYERKAILKDIYKNKIPEEIRRRPKFAFIAPGGSTIFKKDYEYIQDMISEERIRQQGFFNPKIVNKIRKSFLNGNQVSIPYAGHIMMVILTFSIFTEVFHIKNFN
jgi:asparagine synthase (glutamine-hydrolysing)